MESRNYCSSQDEHKLLHNITINVIYTCASQNALILLFGAARFAKLQEKTLWLKLKRIHFYLKQLCCLHEKQSGVSVSVLTLWVF